MADHLDRIWVISNRKDDRTVLWERDDEHPGGEVFIGGSAPAEAARTPEINRLLREGLIVQIPEPPNSRKKPVSLDDVPETYYPNQPGQRIVLGRQMDPEVVPEGAMKSVESQQSKLPDSVPSQATVPPANPSTKS